MGKATKNKPASKRKVPSTAKDTPTKKTPTPLWRNSERDEERLRRIAKALAHRLLLHEKKRNRTKRRRWFFFFIGEESLLKQFLNDPTKFVKKEYNTTEDDTREIAGHTIVELKNYQGILHTHNAMSQAGTVLNTVRWMHLTTFIIGNILLIGTVAFILFYNLGYIPRGDVPLKGGELYAVLGGTGGVGVVFNILYFVWVGPALKIRKALSDTAQLEMSYKTYTLVLNSLDRLHRRRKLEDLLWNDKKYKADPIEFVGKLLKDGGTLEEKEKLLKAVGEVLSKMDLKDSLMVFTRELVQLMEQVSEPRDIKFPKWETMMKKVFEETKKKEENKQ